jgi:hypothetical protein
MVWWTLLRDFDGGLWDSGNASLSALFLVIHPLLLAASGVSALRRRYLLSLAFTAIGWASVIVWPLIAFNIGVID